MRRWMWWLFVVAWLALASGSPAQKIQGSSEQKLRGLSASRFQVEETTIADIQHAIETKQLTTTELLHLYLKRIKAYNGTCVNSVAHILGAPTEPSKNNSPNANSIWGVIAANGFPTLKRSGRVHDRSV